MKHGVSDYYLGINNIEYSTSNLFDCESLRTIKVDNMMNTTFFFVAALVLGVSIDAAKASESAPLLSVS